MRNRILGALTVMLLASATCAATQIHILALPTMSETRPVDYFSVFGFVATDGAPLLTNSDILDYDITLVAPDGQTFSFTRSDSSSTFSGVTASSAGLFMGTQMTDTVDINSNMMCPPAPPIPCFWLTLANLGTPGSTFVRQKMFYGVYGFNIDQLDEVVGYYPSPFATLAPDPPVITLFQLLTRLIKLAAGNVPPGPPRTFVANLGDQVASVQAAYAANKRPETCQMLSALDAEAYGKGEGVYLENGMTREAIHTYIKWIRSYACITFKR